eukprot:1157126-Pelagomonas_calceolata.AAC.4
MEGCLLAWCCGGGSMTGSMPGVLRRSAPEAKPSVLRSISSMQVLGRREHGIDTTYLSSCYPHLISTESCCVKTAAVSSLALVDIRSY